MLATEEQKQEIMNLGNVRVDFTLYSYKTEYRGYINGKEIKNMSERFYQALEFVEKAQHRIRNNKDIDISYYYEYENVKRWLK